MDRTTQTVLTFEVKTDGGHEDISVENRGIQPCLDYLSGLVLVPTYFSWYIVLLFLSVTNTAVRAGSPGGAG